MGLQTNEFLVLSVKEGMDFWYGGLGGVVSVGILVSIIAVALLFFARMAEKDGITVSKLLDSSVVTLRFAKYTSFYWLISLFLKECIFVLL